METTTQTPAAESSTAAVMEVPTGNEAYAHWRMTGELPETPKTEAPAASKKESSGAAAAEEAGAAETRSAPEAESQQEKKAPRSNAETRLNEVLADLRRAGLSPSELKTFRRETQQAAATETQPKAAPSGAQPPEHTAKPAEGSERPVKPDQSKFDTWEKYEAALDEYHEKLGEWHGQQQAAAKRDLDQKFADAKTRYGNEAEETIVSAARALNGDAQIAAAVKEMIGVSPVMVDVLYTLGSKPADLDAFVELARKNPAAAIRKVVLVEQLVTQELAKGGKSTEAAGAAETETPSRDETGKFTPAKKTSQAPPPPREASGRAAAPPDEESAALAAGDFKRYQKAANRRDLQARTGR